MVTTCKTNPTISLPSQVEHDQDEIAFAFSLVTELPAASMDDPSGETLCSLLERHRSGEPYAFSEFWHRLDRIAANGLRNQLHHWGLEGDFDDAFQELRIELWQGYGTFATDRQLINWLYICIVHRALNFHRRKRPIVSSELAFDAAERMHA